MARLLSIAAVALTAAGLAAPGAALAQTPDHAHDHGVDHAADHSADHGVDHAAGHAADPGHNHASAPVDCMTLATPPWMGLPERDRQQVAALQQSVARLSTPDAARAAGFNPALGDIPGMGVHYVHAGRTRAGVTLEEPDHLLFSTIDGEERLVGAAYAFIDAVHTDVPVPFESDLAHWHDHPQFAGPGQTLHMLHVWFIPSSHGPFAGLNFWLPFHAAGIEPPSACWTADEADAERIQTVSFALAASQRSGATAGRLLALRGGATGEVAQERQAARAEMLAAMDAAARTGDRDAWVAAADRYIADLTTGERTVVEGLLRGLTMAQMSTPERDAVAEPR